MSFEAVLICTALALAFGFLALAPRIGGARIRALALAAVLLGSASSLWASIHLRTADLLEAEIENRPIQESANGYVTSGRCRTCHEAEHQSWTNTFHRTMTQRVTASSIRAPFEGEHFDHRGKRYSMFHRDDEFWMEISDLGSPQPAKSPSPRPEVRRTVVLATGSQHMHLYWHSSG